MPQRIDGQMRFAAFAPFGSIVASTMATFWTRLQRATVQNSGRRLFITSFRQPQHGAQVPHDRFKDACLELAVRLLIDRCPRRQVMGHHAPHLIECRAWESLREISGS